jgi:LuxR family quorum sensing-dependent transcriptional regulator
MQDVDSLIAPLATARSREQVFETLAAHIARFGFDWFTYEMLVPPGTDEPFYNTTYPADWMARYIERRHGRSDILLSYMTRMVRPFLWHEAYQRVQLTDAQVSVFKEAGEFGLRSGAVVPLNGPGRVKAYLAVASPLSRVQFERLFEPCRHQLHLLATYAHERFLAINEAEAPPMSGLSPREGEVLTWAALGFSAHEIADELTISAHTVKDHIDNAKMKLEARDKTHAVAIALSRGLIRL